MDEETPVDDLKVEAAAEYISTLLDDSAGTKLQVAIKIGTYILNEFFGGNHFMFTDRGRGSPSLRALLAHPRVMDLDLKHRTLAYYVSVAIQDDRFQYQIKKGRLPDAVRSLGYTHRVRLLPCRKASDETRIAIEAVKENLTAAEIEERVREANATAGGGKKAEKAPEAVLAAMNVGNAIYDLASCERSELSAECLAWFRRFVEAVARRLDEVGVEAEVELRERPGGAEALKALEPIPYSVEELDALLKDIVPNLELGPPRDAEEVMAAFRLRTEWILGDLAHAPGDAATEWFLGLADDVDKVVGVRSALAQHLGIQDPGAPAQTSEPPVRSKPWDTPRGEERGVPLFEKYRPMTFSDVVGCSEAVQVLTDYAKDRTKEVFLVSGPAGSGKTTLARIYGRSYVCTGERPHGFEPCGVCDACQETRERTNNPFLSNIMEVSAATAGDSGEAAEHVWVELSRSTPVVVVNEADRLLTQQQRFLEFLERPRYGPVFFCSTYGEKFEAQFRSRCVEIELEPPGEGEVAQLLRRVAAAEGVTLSEPEVRDILDTLARRGAAGQIRNALNLLDVVLTRKRSG